MSGERTAGALRWNLIALALAGPALIAFMWWVIEGLTPASWCGVLIGAAKEAQVPAPQCTTVLVKLLEIYKVTLLILGGTLAIVIIAIGLAATGLTLRGRFGIGELNMGAEDAARRTAAAADREAERIAEGER